ncbi:hypothetical protein V5O48_008150 [Marasmius crinis-equi]|uniref:Cytochrome P450 n=1 Tax=Marasmius crinis-equi TaxID=585013 RepID=A0ABR3FEP1_9AGAR
MDANYLALGSLATVIVVLLTSRLRRYWDGMAKLSAIPTYGHDGFFSSYITAFEFVKRGTKLVQEGYKKYPNQAFKVAAMNRWTVVVTGKDMVEDLRKAGDDQLSMSGALNKSLQSDLLFGRGIQTNSYHAEVVGGALTRHLASMFGEVYDELSQAFAEEIPLSDGEHIIEVHCHWEPETDTVTSVALEWVKVPTLGKILRIVCRTSNRLFIGLPLCRDEDWKDLNIRHTIEIFTAAGKASIFPGYWLQRLVARYLTPLPRNMKRTMELIGPIIEERLEKFRAGEGDSLADDLLTWLIRAAPTEEQLKPEQLGLRMLTLNVAAIHTTSQAFTHALINLCKHSEYTEPLRKEIEDAIEKEGWTKAAMGRMRMLDSFLKESQRVSSSGAISVNRLTLKEFVFSNGTVLPAGTVIGTSPSALHFDESTYSNPFEFDGLRSYHEREKEGESIKHQMVTPGSNYVAFGVGKHACPGRFFAVNEIKALFSHAILNYDVKLDEKDEPTKMMETAGRIESDSKTQVMFRKRRT